jgi:hypothetical protein
VDLAYTYIQETGDLQGEGDEVKAERLRVIRKVERLMLSFGDYSSEKPSFNYTRYRLLGYCYNEMECFEKSKVFYTSACRLAATVQVKDPYEIASLFEETARAFE